MKLNLELVMFTVRNSGEIARALDGIAVADVGAVNLLASPMLNGARRLIVERLRGARLASDRGLPTGSTAAAGCFASGAVGVTSGASRFPVGMAAAATLVFAAGDLVAAAEVSAFPNPSDPRMAVLVFFGVEEDGAGAGAATFGAGWT